MDVLHGQTLCGLFQLQTDSKNMAPIHGSRSCHSASMGRARRNISLPYLHVQVYTLLPTPMDLDVRKLQSSLLIPDILL